VSVYELVNTTAGDAFLRPPAGKEGGETTPKTAVTAAPQKNQTKGGEKR
jgi:hypothetical protein